MISGINQSGIAAYSSIVRNQPAGGPLLSSPKASDATRPELASTTVTISQQAINAFNSDSSSATSAYDDETKRGCLFLTDKVIHDPEAADSMAYQLANGRDGELINLSDIPLNGPTAKFTTMSDYNEHVAAFDAIASKAQTERQKIYDEMKAGGASGLEIYESLMKFNTTLPADYQKATGIGMVAETFFNSRTK